MLWIDHFGGNAAIGYISGREGGVSAPPFASKNVGLHVGDDPAAVLENRRRVAAHLGVQPERVVYAEQVHGNRVAAVRRRHAGRGAHNCADAMPGVDALVTRDRGVVLAVLAADCLPVLLVDPDAGVLGAAHAGWRGAAAGVVVETVRAMTALGARIERIEAAFGPAIRGCCYEVDEPVLRAVRRSYELAAPGRRTLFAASPAHPDRIMLDLPALCKDQLLSLGVREAGVVDVSICTHCMQGYFSHRRENGRTGRQGAYAALL